jgi:hypothetical protein
LAENVVVADTDLHAQAERMFAEDRVQAVVAVRISGGALGYGTLDLGLLQAVVDTANARGFSLTSLTPAGEHALLVFDPIEPPAADSGE